MKEKVIELMKNAGTDSSGKWMGIDNCEKFAESIVEMCIETLEFYGHNKAIPDIEFMARNRLGVMK
jgi:hypothetical protein